MIFIACKAHCFAMLRSASLTRRFECEATKTNTAGAEDSLAQLLEDSSSHEFGRFMALRSFVRLAALHVFFKVGDERETHNRVSELLEVLGIIINGFALRLKEEHMTF